MSQLRVQGNHDAVRVVFAFDVCERHVDGVINYSGGRAATTGQQTVKADARAAKREIQRRATTNSKPDANAKSSLNKPTAKPAVNRPKRVELVNFRGVLVPKEVEIFKDSWCRYALIPNLKTNENCFSNVLLVVTSCYLNESINIHA